MVWISVSSFLHGSLRSFPSRYYVHLGTNIFRASIRYAEINGYDDVRLEDFTAIIISSDIRQTGTFECSHGLINKLHENTIWSMRGNFVSVPTDCPQRDERLGWTGDIQVFTPTANYLFDTSAFLGDWLKDLEAEQRDRNGVVPTIVPTVPILPPRNLENAPMAVWADAAVLMPWDLYTSFGDEALLHRQWSSMCLWLDHGVPRNEVGFYSTELPQYGDWLDPRAPPHLPGHSPTDQFLIANAYLIHVTTLASRIGHKLGKHKVAEKYDHDAQRLRGLFREEYLTRSGRLSSDSQAAYAICLRFGLFSPGIETETARSRLDWLTRWESFKITTGFAGTPVILHALSDNGMLAHAYRMLQEKDTPSWLYPIQMGATTIVSSVLMTRRFSTNMGTVGTMELHASRRQHQPWSDDFIQPLRPWISLQLSPCHHWRTIAPVTWLEDCFGQAQTWWHHHLRPHVL